MLALGPRTASALNGIGGSKPLFVSIKRIQRYRFTISPVAEEEESLLVLFGHVRGQSENLTKDDAYGLSAREILSQLSGMRVE